MAPLDVEDIISKLTVDEKVALLSGKDFWHTRDIPRLSIPSLRATDGPNGVRGTKFFNGVPAACLPCGTSLAATWDVDMINSAGKLAGREAIAKGAHIILGPTTNIQRSPLGGRGFESYSEDPYLSGALAAAMVNGIQSTGVAATMKHYVCNDGEHERQAVDAIVTERALREIYLMPFQIAQRDSKPLVYMSSYNKVNGTHVSENKRLLTDILRTEWGFDGLVMSDWFGTYDAVNSTKAGLDLEMPGPPRCRGNQVSISLGNRKISEFEVDERVRNLLNLVNRVAPLNIPENAPETTVDSPETSKALRELGASGIVLLKNENNILPYNKEKTTAVIGPNAKFAAYAGGGSANLRPYYAVTPYEGISSYTPAKYALGATAYSQLPLLSTVAKTADGKPGMTCRFYNEPPSDTGRKCKDEIHTQVSDMFLVDYDHPEIDTSLFYMDLEGFFTPEQSGEYLFGCSVRGTAKVYVDGEVVVDNETTQRMGGTFMGAGTVEERGQKYLEAGKTYKVLLQFGSSATQKVRKKGTTTMRGGGVRLGGTLKTDPEAEIKKAVELAKEVDQVVICAGLNGEWESEGFDRTTMDLPGHTNAMISAVAAANPNTVVVVQSGTPVTMPWVNEVSGILQAWYGGNETGNAIADILFGTVNPSGKLPLSFPVRNSDNPAYVNFGSERGRTLYGEDVYVGYRWYEKTEREVLFPFGYGGSFTRFELSDLTIETTGDGRTVSIGAKVKNVGQRDGAEVVQVYVSQVEPSVARPPKELKGFKKVLVKAGEEVRVQVDLEKKYAAAFWDEERDAWAVEKGSYEVLVGNSSNNTPLKGGFDVVKTSWWKGL